MKKIVLAILVMACFASRIDAQIRFGLKAGLTSNKFSISNDFYKPENALGWNAGAMLQIKVPIIGIAVQPELLYTVKNADIAGKSNGIGYFEVPINLQWGPDLVLLRPYVLAGPYFGYAVNTNGDKFKKDDIEKTDWGIGLGAGLDVWKLQVTARYAWGMKNVSGVKDFEMKNRTFTLSAGIFF